MFKNKKALILSVYFIGVVIFWLYVYFLDRKNLNLNKIFYFLMELLSFFGVFYAGLIVKKWGGLNSRLGKALFLLAISFVLNFISSMVLFVFPEFYNSYPIATIILFFFMYISWTFSGLELLYFSGVKPTSLKRWRYLIISFTVVGIIATFISFFQDAEMSMIILQFVTILSDVILLAEFLTLMVNFSRIKQGTLFKAILLFCLGILVQLIGDLVFAIRGSFNLLYFGDISYLVYGLSWFILGLCPAFFPHEK
ncbi:hypothetical protein A2X44_04840 [candidate division CPR3 bacterium GWF2_35_18]|uniref:Uncharacterized protein n=1 Tax=candidate division CPR3 bacterium GW2011_GWF2_35_18 TaxID=1618350 RepID=A0A0G0C0X2_UNCC3|nr:MAG: hypothetical protein UR67_C0003G0049 [candidate division CPR3 bacterium GW2011_GWF2_35_18]OGB63660.1 MAG: hypothetical protein A2X44_04840 [candidate division CPR3 bacterium GWF2_35_18]OGB65019.1 MAG: hypothetical protein A2250_01200 [candidate division CPR3 bacterium RIFOXYA2_FULL_35_13]OGB76019.1 MAG: hypothetical protein A2476_02150 [candidate division CPR3 bacterium RIFOXYC2_FULL_35_7]OGB79551.1 MAG: hypothetical protein A2296_04500 [candidate division CPR3 bacterium RIFOXYB2_FULL_3